MMRLIERSHLQKKNEKRNHKPKQFRRIRFGNRAM